MRPRTPSLALCLALSIWTALPTVEVCWMPGVGSAAACDDAPTARRTARTAVAAHQPPMAPAACAVRCDGKRESFRIAGHATTASRSTERSCATTSGTCDPQQEPLSNDSERVWCVGPQTDAVTTKSASISLPVAPLWFATLADPSILQKPFRAMGEWARRKTPAPHSADRNAPPQSRAPPLWVGELL
jgi:hypothetical protein